MMGIEKMKIFDAKAYKEKVQKSTCIKDCEKIEIPENWEGKKYIFISYSHENYKQVYCDLADMYANGIVFWYDKGLTPGESWKKEVENKINHPNCVGVLFYPSIDFFLSENVYTEIKCANKRFEKNTFLSVNLAKEKPEELLFNILNPDIVSKAEVDSSKIKDRFGQLLEMVREDGVFGDEITYLDYSSMNHTRDLIAAIEKRFDVKHDEIANPSKIDLLFSVLDNISSLKIKNYSKQHSGDYKNCRITRASFISLCKEICNEDLDTILSSDYSVEELNQIISVSQNPILREFMVRGLSFIDSYGFVCIKGVDYSDNQEDVDYFKALEYLFSSYQKQEELHNNYSSVKKREINLSISEYVNAMAHNHLFKTTEQKLLLQSIVEQLIATHNHYCNYMYAILFDKNTKKVPALLNDDIVFDLVGRYFDDIYQTNHDSVMFINNLIGFLDLLDESRKVSALRDLVFFHHGYSFQLIKKLIDSTSGTELGVVRNWLRDTVFSIAKNTDGENVDDNYATLTAFLCMFSRGSYNKVCYGSDALYNKEFYGIIKYALKSFAGLIKRYPERCGDLSTAIYRAIVTLFITNNERAEQIFMGIDINKDCFSEARQLRDLYELVVNGVVSDYSNLIDSKNAFVDFFDVGDDDISEQQFFKYVEEKLLSIKENPFLSKSNVTENPFLLQSFLVLQKMLHEERFKDQYFDVKLLCDKLVFWMIESVEQVPNPTYIRIIVETKFCFDCRNTTDLKKLKNKLYRKLLQQQKFDSLPLEKLEALWSHFYGEIKRDKTSELATSYRKCIKYCLTIKKNIFVARFLYNSLQICDADIKEQIYNYLKDITLASITSLNYQFIRVVVDSIRKNKFQDNAFIYKLLELVPEMNQLSDADKYKLFGDIASLIKYCVIIDSIVNEGENSRWYKTISLLLTIKNITWERVNIFGVCSKLLTPENYKEIDYDLRIKLIHYAKNLPEYRTLIAHLIEALINDGTFISMSTVEKTALFLHASDYLDIFEDKYRALKGFSDKIIYDLSYGVLTHRDIQRKYGVKTETLTYHLLNNYKYNPEAVAVICAKSISQIYGQIIYTISNAETFDLHNLKLANDRSNSFKEKISNPCIRNTALFFCNKMYSLLNLPVSASAKKYFNDLYQTIIEVKKENWPLWFNIETSQIDIIEEDEIKEDVVVQIKDYITSNKEVSLQHEKEVQEALALWRQEDNISLPLYPVSPYLIHILESQKNNDYKKLYPSSYVVSYKDGNNYRAISGADTIKLCQEIGMYDIVPTEIVTNLVKFGKCHITNKVSEPDEKIDVETLVKMFDEIYEKIMKTVPRDCIKQKDKKIWFRVGDSLSKFNSKSVLENNISYYIQEFNNFLTFYFCYIKRYDSSTGKARTIIKDYVLPPYVDYYNNLKDMINNFEGKLV